MDDGLLVVVSKAQTINNKQFYKFALASRTATMKNMPVKGTLAARIIPVTNEPNCGFPEDNSKIEPTAAIAATQEPSKNTPLFGVIISFCRLVELFHWFNSL
jgi:hypothetical protein